MTVALWAVLYLLTFFGLCASIAEAYVGGRRRYGWEQQGDYERAYFYVGLSVVMASLWFGA